MITMSTPDFDKSFKFVLEKCEGVKYTDLAADNGGATKFGLSDMADGVKDGKYRGIPIKTMTLEQAKVCFLNDYWKAAHCDLLVGWLALVVYDTSVNQGPGRSIRILQQALGVVSDGQFGVKTLMAANGYRACTRGGKEKLLAKLLAIREDRYRVHEDWPTFGKGWLNRLKKVRQEALKQM